MNLNIKYYFFVEFECMNTYFKRWRTIWFFIYIFKNKSGTNNERINNASFVLSSRAVLCIESRCPDPDIIIFTGYESDGILDVVLGTGPLLTISQTMNIWWWSRIGCTLHSMQSNPCGGWVFLVIVALELCINRTVNNCYFFIWNLNTIYF